MTLRELLEGLEAANDLPSDEDDETLTHKVVVEVDGKRIEVVEVDIGDEIVLKI